MEGENSMRKIYVAGGCFWGVQGYFQKVKGVLNTKTGYANGKTENTSYYELKDTDHVECVEIEYDENIIHLAEIFDRLYTIIDVTSINKQGNDVGRQYRTGIYYLDNYSYKCAKLSLEILQKNIESKVQIELEPLKNFIVAEDYHQNYLINNPNGYCHINLNSANMKISNKKSLSNEEIKNLKLDELSYNVLINKDTERPFSSEYDKNFEVGIYVDKISGQALFSSEDKFDAGCGWPSFTKPITTDALDYQEDLSYGRIRTEVLSSIQDAHLGHVFADGPTDLGGLRYCINGASLVFIPIKDFEKFGYFSYLPYFSEYVEE